MATFKKLNMQRQAITEKIEDIINLRCAEMIGMPDFRRIVCLPDRVLQESFQKNC